MTKYALGVGTAPPFADELDTAKRASVGQLLLRAARLYNERAIPRARHELGLPGLRPSHLSLMPHIDLQGTRAATIATRAGISKQAVAQLVDDLERMGMVQRRPDPQDGRAKLVMFTRRGQASLLAGIGVLRTVEDELREQIGDPAMDELHQALLAVVDVLERTASEDGEYGEYGED